MTEKLIVNCCAPTLAGLKTGSMFTCDYDLEKNLMCSICNLNKRLKFKGVSAIPLRWKNGKALIYIFRPDKLSQDLNLSESREILNSLGYEYDTNKCLAKLLMRMRTDKKRFNDFPHEVGLFLGYPPSDVKAFIDCNGKGYKFIGGWKSYDESEKTKDLFEKFSKCTLVYKEAINNGIGLEKLTVKTR